MNKYNLEINFERIDYSSNERGELFSLIVWSVVGLCQNSDLVVSKAYKKFKKKEGNLNLFIMVKYISECNNTE